MSRRFWRARDREGGFTFAELLVTIIIAGLAFAAMVPVFMGASQASSGDLLRNAALQLAQDKLEKVRGLDYDVITTENLTNNSIPNGQFGTNVSWTTGGGGERSFAITYRVDLIDRNGNAGAAAGTENYKQVTITAQWTAPPQPVKPVTLSTMVSKQYAGPQIVRFDVGPSSILDSISGTTEIISGPVVLDAWLAPEDVGGMHQSAAESERGYVLFTVTPLSGGTAKSQKVTVPVSGQATHYQYTWDNSSAPDDIYILQAVAVAGFGSRAQGSPVGIALKYTNHVPAAPTGLGALAGDANVLLTWVASTASDRSYYEVERSTDGVTWAKIGQVTNEAFQDVGAVGGITNGTAYSYRVRTVDTENLTGPYTSPITSTPNLSPDNDAPTIPTWVAVTVDPGQPTVHLQWTASTDGGTPASGLAGYIIERQRSGSATWETLQSLYQSTVYEDTSAGWSTTWTYRVRAVDMAGNQSGNLVSTQVTTVVPVLRTITVTNNSAIQVYAWLQNVVTSQWYSTSGVASSARPTTGVWVKKNGSSVVWNNIPNGLYNVYFYTTSTWDTASYKITVPVDVNSQNAVVTYQ